MPIQQTRPRALEDALAAQFALITPSHAVQQGAPWVWAEDRREIPPSMRTRRFRFEWGKAEVVPGGLTGMADTEVAIEMRVVTDYRALREEDLGDLTEQDFWDLHDRMWDRLDPIVPGLTWVDPVAVVVDDPEAFVIAHEFRIQYSRARAAA